MARPPPPGADYYGVRVTDQYPRVEALIEVFHELHVSRSGRRLTSAVVRLWCGRTNTGSSSAFKLSFRGNPAAVIRRDGTFGFAAVGSSRTEGRVRLWLSGRFVSAQYARLFYRVRFPLRHRRDCRATHERYPDWSPAALYRDGKPPFSGCRSQRAGTLLRTDTGRVFQQLTLGEFTSFVTHVYACIYEKPHRRVDLGRNYDEEQVRVPRLSGTFVAYWWGQLRVIDLRDPASVRLVDTTPGFETVFPQPASDLVLKANGAIAWTILRSEPEVWALDAGGLRQLDGGPALEPESLELTGSTLSWVNGGTRSAVLD
jgi:hypothetical protein